MQASYPSEKNICEISEICVTIKNYQSKLLYHYEIIQEHSR